MGPFAVPPALRFHHRELSVPFGIGYFFQSKVYRITAILCSFFGFVKSLRGSGKILVREIAVLYGNLPPRDRMISQRAKHRKKAPARFVL